MSGFLQRLASHAMGNANTLRSTMRLPYATPALPEYPAAERLAERADAPESSGVKGRHHATNAGNRALDRDPRRAVPPAESAAQRGTNHLIPPLPELLVAPAVSAPAAKPGRFDAPPPALAAEKMSLPEGPEFADGLESGSSALRDGGVMSFNGPMRVEQRGPRIAADDFASARGGEGEPFRDFTENVFPAPLLPQASAARSFAWNGGAPAQRRDPAGIAWQRQVEQTTEVHVSIGRIEVTAVHEAPPRKREAPAARKPMSLDEYLARRKGEA